MRSGDDSTSRVARLVLTTFLFTFVAARILVLLIMSRRMPDLYLHVRGSHIHHLSYGIVLLSAVGAYLLFAQPHGRRRAAAAIVYGIGLGLTFDEFGMWIRLGGSYWQRASFDAVVVVATVLALIAFSPALKAFRTRHWVTAALLAIAVATFTWLLAGSLRNSTGRLGTSLERLEERGPQ